MLYVYYGTDTIKSLEKARTLIANLQTKKPDSSFVEYNAENWHPSLVEEHAGGQGLFSSKYIVFLNRVAEKAEVKEWLATVCGVMGESANIFIVLEGKVNADLKKKFENHAQKVVQVDAGEKVSSGQGFNIFNLADALGSRNAFKSWSIYRDALDEGTLLESIIGTLFWQVKSMLLAGRSSSASQASLSPFVYSKSKKYAENYSREELSSILERLIRTYHDSHRGLVDGELEIERMLLTLKRGV